MGTHSHIIDVEVEYSGSILGSGTQEDVFNSFFLHHGFNGFKQLAPDALIAVMLQNVDLFYLEIFGILIDDGISSFRLFDFAEKIPYHFVIVVGAQNRSAFHVGDFIMDISIGDVFLFP